MKSMKTALAAMAFGAVASISSTASALYEYDLFAMSDWWGIPLSDLIQFVGWTGHHPNPGHLIPGFF